MSSIISKDPPKGKSCKLCYFCRLEKKEANSAAKDGWWYETYCYRYPKKEYVNSDHWCGEFLNKLDLEKTKGACKMSKVGDCIYFNGFQNKECKAKVNYNKFREKDKGIILPCLTINKHIVKTSCDKYKGCTKKEINKINAEFNNILEALLSIAIDSRKQGSIPCPKCGKDLHFSIAGNGHVWGKCETKDCLNWVI
jgi:hypothetical protein